MIWGHICTGAYCTHTRTHMHACTPHTHTHTHTHTPNFLTFMNPVRLDSYHTLLLGLTSLQKGREKWREYPTVPIKLNGHSTEVCQLSCCWRPCYSWKGGHWVQSHSPQWYKAFSSPISSETHFINLCNANHLNFLKYWSHAESLISALSNLIMKRTQKAIVLDFKRHHYGQRITISHKV